MATRSTISILKKNGEVRSVYCHWDGYPSNNGVILLVHYEEPKKVNQLFKLGDISSLGKHISPVEGEETPEDKVTQFYGRDRNEKNVSAKKFANLEEYATKADFQEYDYLFDETKKKWFLYDPHEYKLKDLSVAVEEVKEDISPGLKQDYEFFIKEKEIQANFNQIKKSVKSKKESVAKKMKV